MSGVSKNSCKPFQARSSRCYGKKCTLPDLSSLTRGELEGIVLNLWERLEALESKVTKSSRSSSQPPFTDGLCKTTSLRELSGNKPDAQPGLKGNTLKADGRAGSTPPITRAM